MPARLRINRITRNSFFMTLATVVTIAAGTSFGLPGVAKAAVWETRNSWSPAWESKYQEWVRTEWNRDYFRKPGPYQGLKLDCADAVYSMRIIFAQANGLPFAINDSTAGSGVISNRMTKWDHLPALQRARQFVIYVSRVGSTVSLVSDSYPVAVHRDGIHAGVFLRSDQKSHHSWTVKDISRTGIPFLLFATRPASPKLYERHEYPSMGFLFHGSNAEARQAGFRMYRYEADLKKPVWQVPGYSRDQYQISLSKWTSTLQSRLALKKESPEEKVQRLLIDACRGVSERVDFVYEALDTLKRMGNRLCMTSAEFDDYSTPSRDRRMRDSLIELETAYRQAKSSGTLDPQLSLKVESVLMGEQSVRLGPNSYCTIEWARGRFLTMGQVYQRVLENRLSTNPHDPAEIRWGEVRGPSARAKTCSVD